MNEPGTSDQIVKRDSDQLSPQVARDIDHRLGEALWLAGNSGLGLPGTVDTFKAMLESAGLALVLR